MNVETHPHISLTTTQTHTKAITEAFRKKLPYLAFFPFHRINQKQQSWESLPFSPIFLSLSLSLSCPWKRRGQAQTAWERLTTRGSERRYIKGHPICTAAYTHPHIHKHRLTYLGLLSLKFITSGRTITLFDSMCVSQLQEGRVQLINSSTWPKS